MKRAGLDSLFPMEELSLMGLVEVLPHLPLLWRRLRQVEAAIRAWRPHVVVTVDAPGFNFRLARRLAGSGIPVVHYVAPSVWAWRPGRAREIAPLFRHLMALLPFEPPWFERWGLATTYVGHPALDIPRPSSRPEDGSGRPRRLCLLPGSRSGELRRHLPVFAATVALLSRSHPGLEAVLPTVPAVAEAVRAAVRDWPDPPRVIVERPQSLAAMAQADVALAASGTVTLELALLGTPTVATYRTSAVTAAILRRLVRVRHATLVNLVLDRAAIPELLQTQCRPALLAEAVARLLDDPREATAQRAAFAEVARRLAVDGSPSDKAATVVAAVVREQQGRGP